MMGPTPPIHTTESWLALQADWWAGKVDDDRPIPLSTTWAEMDEVMRETGKNEYEDEFPDEHSHEPQVVPGEPFSFTLHAQDSEGRHYHMSHKVTHEGIIIDVWDRYGEECLATFARTFDELVDFVFANDPMTGRQP